jgi:hypothetical protein
MEQDINSISWKDLPWKKFQKKSFRLQCKIYKAKQCSNFRLVRRLQKLLVKSKSLHYLAVRTVAKEFLPKGLFLSNSKKFFLVEESYYKIGDWKYQSFRSFSNNTHSKESFNTSFLRNKITEYVWKFVIEPTCVSNLIEIDSKWFNNSCKKFIKNCIPLIKFKDQPILKLAINPNLMDINFNILVSRLWLPSLYKIGIYRGLKHGRVELDCNHHSLIFTLFETLLHSLEELNNVFIGKYGSMPYMHKSGFRWNNEIFYFLRKDQDKVYLWNLVREFLENRGLNINSNCISIEELESGFTFSKWSLRFRMSKRALIFPNSISWNKYKKELIHTLKKEQITADLKIKKLQSMLLNWIQYNNFCSKVKLKANFFYLKKFLAKYN